MTQSLSDLRQLLPPKPEPAKAQPQAKPQARPQAKAQHKPRPAAGGKPREKVEPKYSIDAVLAVVPPNAQVAARWAMTTFPLAFPLQPFKIRPLAIGIAAELQGHVAKAEPPLPEGEFSRFMTWWCRRGAYLRATVAGGKRITLSGEPAEDLNEQAINHARNILERKTKGRVKAAVASPGAVAGADKDSKSEAHDVIPLPLREEPGEG